MSLPRIVCPNNKRLLQSFTGLTVAVRVKRAAQAEEAAARVRDSGNELFCVIVESDLPLDAIELRESQKGIPLAVMAPSFGKFRNLVKSLDMLRQFNLRVYLPCDEPENLIGLRILSSVGVHGCVVFSGGKNDWEALADLMTYAVLERAPHASIEPFTSIATSYDPFSYFDWGSIHFDDPKHFLHLDSKGRVALSRRELRRRKFVAQSLSEIGSPEDFPPIREGLEAWRQYFVDGHPCASCGAWKICLGKFADRVHKDNGCSDFFLEAIEVARQHKGGDTKGEEHLVWRP